MCLTLKKEYSTQKGAKSAAHRPRTAKEDIIVYKRLFRRKRKEGIVYVAPYRRRFVYEQGQHYYQDGNPFSFTIQDTGGSYEVNIHEGLHACITKDSASWRSGNTTIEMIVPKGAKYFLGNNNDIVSDQLIWR